MPTHVTIDVGVALSETSARHRDYSQGVRGMACNFAIADHSLTQELKASQGAVFQEDVAVLEAQQMSVRHNPGLRLAVLNIDAGGGHTRRLIARELAGAD